jgi:hypothetical protein
MCRVFNKDKGEDVIFLNVIIPRNMQKCKSGTQNIKK